MDLQTLKYLPSLYVFYQGLRKVAIQVVWCLDCISIPWYVWISLNCNIINPGISFNAWFGVNYNISAMFFP